MTTPTTLSLDSIIIDDVFDSTQNEKPLTLLNDSFEYAEDYHRGRHGDKGNADMRIESVTDISDQTQGNSLNVTQQSSQRLAKGKTLLSKLHKQVNITQEVTAEDSCSSISTPQASVESELNISSLENRSTEKSSSGSALPRSPVLPPCRICHGKASGIHYGLNTCEACKGFFRRTFKRNTNYKCLKNSKCDVVRRRSSCSYCRFKKCIDLGMSKAAIKSGRYTHEFRSKNIIEVQQNVLGVADLSESAPSFQEICPQSRHESPNIDPTLEGWIEIVDQAQNLLYEELDNYLSKDIMAVKQQKCKERYRTFCQNLGVTRLSEDTTDFSLEKRQVLLQIHVAYMENGIKGVVAFCKQIPDFTMLHIDDKAALIRNSVFEIWLIGVHKCMDREKTVITGMDSMHRDELNILWGKDLIHKLFNTLECLQKLDLTRQEMGILRGLCLTFADRVDLQNRSMVEELHWKFVECFRYLTLQHFPNFESRFSRLISCLVTMRDFNEQFLKTTGEMKLVWPVVQDSPIAYEVFFSD
ncbi:hypothetical protein CHS0354_040742 [Potamilus streckersoni]|uniref:Uncharacterized protein n=1 Tax=Potamilus streckersoni TaxID=2493646 RepID=A0AAE0SLM5_9BIVA|nr:hypothetical protein CHS0354_040742 [Potamilus streckersoni]